MSFDLLLFIEQLSALFKLIEKILTLVIFFAIKPINGFLLKKKMKKNKKKKKIESVSLQILTCIKGGWDGGGIER